jgi:hypothetical protein
MDNYQCHDNNDKCSACKNPNGRDGVLCPDGGDNSGYYCPDKYNFACIDWSFGAKNLQVAEKAFNERTGMNVKFGFGTYGTNEPMQGLGMCLRMKHDGSDQELIL